MSNSTASATRRILRGLAVSAFLMATSSMSIADPFTAVGGFDGGIRVFGPDQTAVVPGGEAMLMGRGFQPNQPVFLRQNGEALNGGEPFMADDKGSLRASLAIPDTANPGMYPVVAELGGDAPYATTFDLTVSAVLAETGLDAYDVTSAATLKRPYQVVYGNGALYIAASEGRPPITETYVAKIDPETLEVIAKAQPGPAPERDGRDMGHFAVHGIGIDEEAGQIWVSNTHQDTVAVYDANDLSLIKQFDAGLVSHPRDVVAHGGKVYVTATFTPKVHVFDSQTLQELPTIEPGSARRGETFGAAGLSLAAGAGKLFVASLGSDEVAVIDLATGTQSGGFPVPGSKNTIGIAVNDDGTRAYAVGQNNDIVSVIDVQSGEVLRQVNVGAKPLNAVVEPQSGNVFVTVRSADHVVVLSPEGEILANLPTGSLPNHLTRDDMGNVFVVHMARRGADASLGNKITRISAAE
ncbi:YncE family protein [Microbulbifer sp. S227A]|uniref:YncE family protein n=1 Tax=Microbulbifer sp. S227A TaxID=3415131 RepID=UPI003C7A3DB0